MRITFDRIKKHPLSILLFLAFGLWCWAFRDFLLGRLALQSDAISYYDHIKYYLLNIAQGVYPLWDHVWNCGVPNEFFLRRIGPFNPFLFLPLIFHKLGVSYPISHRFYLAVYYFVGAAGFYLLARSFLRDRGMAFLAFLLLLFSSLGTRILDSYIVLVFTPGVWFFYFLFDFSREPRRHSFLGIIFTLMIILTTYIPFYFLTIALVFLASFLLVFTRLVPVLCGRYWAFLKRRKLLAFAGVLSVALALVPQVKFFLETGKGEVALPLRHTDRAEEHILSVDREAVKTWGVAEELLYSSVFLENLREFKFAVLYIPLMGFIIFFLGLATPVDRRQLFLLVCGTIFFVIATPLGTPVYHYLYEYVFFFRYFRNLQFFLWLAILPVFLLLITGQLKKFMDYRPASQRQRASLLIFLFLVHALIGAVLLYTHQPIITTFIVIPASFVFFVLYFSGFFANRKYAPICCLAFLVILQPLEVYHFLAENAQKRGGVNRYEHAFLDFSYRLPPNELIKRTPDREGYLSVYYATQWYSSLTRLVPAKDLNAYVRHKFILYDSVIPLTAEEMDFQIIREHFMGADKGAMVMSSSPEVRAPIELFVSRENRRGEGRPITGDTGNFQVLDFNANGISFRTRFDRPRFLVYTDNYHKKWRAAINGKAARIWQAQVAFKGLVLPAGENIVHLRYGKAHERYYEEFLIFLFAGVLACLFLFWTGDRAQGEDR